MALTLTEAAKLANDEVLAGVIQTIAEESILLQRLPFIEVVGNGLTYNKVNVQPSADFYDVGGDWDESTPTFTQATAVLKILGGDADVDNFLAQTRRNVMDITAETLAIKARAVRVLLEDTLINGDDSVDTKSFDGLDVLIPAGQTVTMGTDGDLLSLEKLDELIDEVRGGAPDVLIMSRRTRRTLNQLARDSGAFLETERNEFGKFFQLYNGIPIDINDYISDAKTVGATTTNSTVYAVRFGGDGLGFSGLQAGGGDSIIQLEEIGNLETKDAKRHRVKAYVSCALFNTLAAAKLTGVQA